MSVAVCRDLGEAATGWEVERNLFNFGVGLALPHNAGLTKSQCDGLCLTDPGARWLGVSHCFPWQTWGI